MMMMMVMMMMMMMMIIIIIIIIIICDALDTEMTDKWCTHMPKPKYEEEDVTVLWNRAVHTDREVTAIGHI